MSRLLQVVAVAFLFTACLIRTDSRVASEQEDAAAKNCLNDVFRTGSVYDAQKNKSTPNGIDEKFKFELYKGLDPQGRKDMFVLNISEKLHIELEDYRACEIMSKWGMSVGLNKDGHIVAGFAEGATVKVKESLAPFTFDTAPANDSGIIVRIAPVIDTPDDKEALEIFSIPMLAPEGMPADAPPLIVEGFFMNANDHVFFQSKEVSDFFALLTERLKQPMSPFDPPGLTQYNQIIPQLRQMSGLDVVPLELKW